MKKNLFYLFALICSMSLFTACSDDDEDTLWREIPTAAISGSNANLTFNGVAVPDGAVQMSVLNESEGLLTLQNVVRGYANVAVDVELEKESATSFRFAGDKDLYDSPSTREDMRIPALTVGVTGSIGIDGKVTVTVTAQGPALFAGYYGDDLLSLTYEGNPLLGTRYAAYTIESGVPVLSLLNIVPGEDAAILVGVYPDLNGHFESTAQTAAGNTVTVKGNFADNRMTIDVDVELAAANMGGLKGDWTISKALYGAQGLADNTAVEMTWTPKDYTQANAMQASQMVNIMVSNLLCEVLDEVDFDDDGTLNATFNAQPKKIQGDVLQWIMGRMQVQAPTITVENTTWTDSDDRGANLVFWYVKDNLLYIKPNVENIIATLAANDKIDQTTMASINAVMQALSTGDLTNLTPIVSKLSESLGFDLSAFLTQDMMAQVKNWLQYGIPLMYEISGSNLHIYVNKAMCAPFMPIAFSYLASLQKQLTEKAQAEAMNGNMQVAQTMQQFMQMLGISSLTDLQAIWEQNTDNFEIGINLVKE